MKRARKDDSATTPAPLAEEVVLNGGGHLSDALEHVVRHNISSYI